MREKIIRYKNKTLYSPSRKEWLSFEDIRSLPKGGYIVLEKRKDITQEIAFLAEVDYIIKMRLYKDVTITYTTKTRER